MAHMQISTETSAWLLQAKDFLVEARRLKPGPARNELSQVAKRACQPRGATRVSTGRWSARENLIGADPLFALRRSGLEFRTVFASFVGRDDGAFLKRRRGTSRRGQLLAVDAIDPAAWKRLTLHRPIYLLHHPAQPKREIGPFSSKRSPRFRDACCRGIRRPPPRAAIGRSRSGLAELI